MALDYGVDMRQQLFGTIRSPEAIAALEAILGKATAQVIIGKPQFDDRLVRDAALSFELSENVYRRMMHNRQERGTRAGRGRSAATKAPVFALRGKATPDEYTKLEQTVGAIYCTVLGLEEVNIYDSFFDIGGNSILAVKVEMDLEQLDLPITISDLYTYRSVAELISFLELRSTSQPTQSISLSGATQMNLSARNSSKVVLDNIMPFNTVFYKTCFHNSLFPVISHFNRSILPFAANDLFIYDISSVHPLEERPMRNIPHKTIPDLLQDMGVCIVHRTHSTLKQQEFTPTVEDTKLLGQFSYHIGLCEIHERRDISNVIADIINALTNNRPIIIWVDCFYESQRKDTFKKEHWMHTLLIYGYDDNEKMFYVVEHTYRDNLTYRELRISYDDIFNAYQGFISNYQPYVHMPTFYEFYAEHDTQSTLSYLHVFTENIRNHQYEITQGLNSLPALVRSINTVLLHKTKLQQHIDSVINTLNAIVTSKQIEYYNIYLLFKDNKIVDDMRKIVESWTIIRQVLIKYKYSQVYNHSKIFEITQQLNALVMLEQSYYAELLNTEPTISA